MAGLRIGLIGLGMAVGPHAKGLNELRRDGLVDVAACFSPSAKRRAAFADTYGLPVVDDVRRILDDPSIRAVGILTPPNTHLELVSAAAGAGKHILLEKPLDVSMERAEALVAIAEKAGLRLGVVLQHRFRPSGERAAEIIRSGALGRIVNCSTSIRLWRPQSYYDEPGRGTRARDGGGVLLTQGIHTLDLMLSLVGPVAEARGFVATTPVHQMETEDLVAAAVRYESGALGVIEATTAAYPGAPERIDIAGERGTISLAGTLLEVAFQDGRRERIAPDATPGGTGADPMAFPHDYHRSVWRDFVTAVGAGSAPRVTGREALKVHGLIEMLLDAGRR